MSDHRLCWVGVASPYQITTTITAGDSGFDLSTVTAAEYEVTAPGGDTATWSADVLSAVTATAVVRHIFASDGSDVAVAGQYRFVAKLTTPDGPLYSEGGSFVAQNRPGPVPGP